MDLEEDLGIDSIKRVEILSKLQEEFPALSAIPVEDINALNTLGEIIVAASDEPQLTHNHQSPAREESFDSDQDKIQNYEAQVLSVISEKTGYPAESLDASMNLEEDLGIDSIKRVEIISELQESFPQLAELSAEDLGEIATINELVFVLDGSAEKNETSRPMIADSEPTLMAPSPSQDAATIVFSAIADKTGYPEESLEGSMSLEEDLGIDSIKRVEILSQIGENFSVIAEAAQEDLAEIHTIDGLLQFISGGAAETASVLDQQDVAVAPSKAEIVPSAEEAVVADAPVAETFETVLPRKALDLKEIDAAQIQTLTLRPGGKVWISDDGSNLARNLLLKLRDLGLKPKLVSTSAIERMAAPDELDGLVILGPLKLETHPSKYLQNCFRLLKLCAPALQRNDAEGKFFVTVSRNEGNFGLNGLDNTSQVFSASLAGLSKTCRWEWPTVRSVHLDLAKDFKDGMSAAARLVEGFVNYNLPELAIHQSKMEALELNDVVQEDRKPLDINSGDVVLVTGGARGVTAATLIEFAKKYPAKLILWGRTEINKELPEFFSKGLDEAALKKEILAQGLAKTPVEIGKVYHSLTALQEAQETLRVVRDLGRDIEYHAVDCTNESQMRRAMDQIELDNGPITGVIHGAGVLADKFIPEVEDGDFLRVVDTKIRLLNLIEKKIPQLKLLALFSSSTARFGRKGQVAYSVANEVLNKFAQLVRTLNEDCRSIAFNWGPWDGEW